MLNGVSTLLRLASRLICLIVVASFVVFAVEQTSSASIHQQNELKEGSTAATAPTRSGSHGSKGTVHKAIDEAASTLTSPFSGATAGSHNQWAIRGVGLVLALLVYGFGLGFLARMLRVRV